MAIQPKYPVNKTLQQSISGSSSGTFTISVPSDKSWLVKHINMTLGGSTSIDDVKVDGQSLGLTSDTIDCATEFGGVLVIRKNVVVDVSNSALTSESSTLEVKGTEPQ